MSKCAANQVFLLGEDVGLLNGLVICANSIQKSQFKGGLGVAGKKTGIEIHLTFVNSGKLPIVIDPLKDFSLRISKEYLPVGESGKNVLEKQFTIYPGTQSRGNLLFLVDENDDKDYPMLFCKRNTPPIAICCEPEISNMLEKATAGILDVDRTIKLTQFLIDYERMTEAEKIVNSYLEKEPNNSVFLLQKMTIDRWFGRFKDVSQITSTLSERTDLSKEEAVTLAKEAFVQGQIDVAQKLLEPLGEKGLLSNGDLLLLARCWYFDRQYERAEILLKELSERGNRERTLFFTLGNIADKRGDLLTAIKWWKKTLEIDPTHYEAMFNIGVANYKQGNHAEAKECWNKVLEMNPDPETRKITEEALANIQ